MRADPNMSSHFFDSAANNAPRPAPSPAQMQQAAAAMGPIVMSPGQVSDMNHLWQVICDLSGQLAANRQATAGLLANVERLRSLEEGSSPSIQETNNALNTDRNAELASLTTKIQDLESRLTYATRQWHEWRDTAAHHVKLLESLKDLVAPLGDRIEAERVQTWAKYNCLLQAERDENLRLRLEMLDWQAGLGRAAHFARMTYRSISEDRLPYVRLITGLKTENDTLRRLLGWEERPRDWLDADEAGEEPGLSEAQKEEISRSCEDAERQHMGSEEEAK